MKLPVSMMIALRGRFNLDKEDSSKDDEIMKLTPAEIVRECTGWCLGDPGWASKIARYMRYAGCSVDDLADF